MSTQPVTSSTPASFQTSTTESHSAVNTTALKVEEAKKKQKPHLTVDVNAPPRSWKKKDDDFEDDCAIS